MIDHGRLLTTDRGLDSVDSTDPGLGDCYVFRTTRQGGSKRINSTLFCTARAVNFNLSSTEQKLLSRSSRCGKTRPTCSATREVTLYAVVQMGVLALGLGKLITLAQSFRPNTWLRSSKILQISAPSTRFMEPSPDNRSRHSTLVNWQSKWLHAHGDVDHSGDLA